MSLSLRSLASNPSVPLDQGLIERALSYSPSAPPSTVVAPVGGTTARLLAGPPGQSGAESLESHLGRLGHLQLDGGIISAAIRDSGLTGRGGGSFPAARKLHTAATTGGRALIVVNASESEPASRKDGTLCRLRPHLVLDGAAAAAAAAGADQAVVHLHRGAKAARQALERALAERVNASLPDPTWYLSEGPNRYVAGEASAVVSFLEGGDAKPRFNRQPAARLGVHGRPTAVNNAETVAHLALLARFGARWWRGAGTEDSPGSRLVTVTDGVSEVVLEVVGPATIGVILGAAGVGAPPAAVLIGGYAGTWVDGDLSWTTRFDQEALRATGASIGCGLLGVLPHGRCGLQESARLVRYLAQESAGQCGPCVLGLAELAQTMTDLARGHARRSDLRTMRRRAAAIVGRGACRHPDGVVALGLSALDAFDDDVARHLAGRPCRGVGDQPLFPLPLTEPGWR